MGQYVVRIFEEVKGRPLYFFKQTPGRKIRGFSGQGSRLRKKDGGREEKAA
jgi:hypothetical protein